jgi:hypothetical protein
MSYYKDQLSKVNTITEFPPTIKISSVGGDTNWMSLNEESAKEIAEWLMEKYPITMMKLEDVPDRKSELV